MVKDCKVDNNVCSARSSIRKGSISTFRVQKITLKKSTKFTRFISYL